MSFDPKHEEHLDALEVQLRRAPALTPDLISKVIANACTRLLVLKRAGKAACIDQLIEAGAWDDAALAVIELELPDARHEVLPLAILSAFVEARRMASAMRETSLQTVPPIRRTSGYAICCDNFS